MSERVVVRTVDLETTDFPPEADVIELGYVDSILERDDAEAPWTVTDIASRALQKFFKPDRTISHQARATHHIRDEELADAVHHSRLLEFVIDPGVSIYCAHNADFEMKFIQIPDGSFWIDTYKVALRLFPNYEKHNNQFLRYALGLDLDGNAMPPHRALPDSYTTAHILASMLSRPDVTLKAMIQWSKELPYLTKVGFGKHFGQRFEDVPRSYLSWCLSQSDMEPAIHAACRRVLYPT